jgi:hypothetical protein
MRIEITNGFVEIRDTMNRTARKAYNSALFSGVNMTMRVKSGQTDDKIDFPVANIYDMKDALMTSLVIRAVVDGLEIKDLPKYMSEEMSEDDYDKVARECQKLADAGEGDEEKKTRSSKTTAA